MIISVRLQSLLASAIILSLGVIPSPSSALGQQLENSQQSTAGSFEPDLSPARQLQFARNAIQNKNPDLAEHFISTAELLMKRSTGQPPLSYTPAMARKELELLKSGKIPAGNSVTASSQNANVASPTAISGDAATIAAAQRALLKTRQALTHGDVETATKMLQSAKQFKIDFQSIGDSPATVASMIERQNQLAAAAANAKQGQADPSYNAGAASFLLTQAEALIYYRDLETAELLINQAEMFPVEFTSDIGDPEKLKKLLNDTKKSMAAAQSKPTPKANAMKLMSQAQLAMDQERWTDAQALVQQAKTLGVAEDQFAANEQRPWQMELKIQNALNRQSFDPAVIRTSFNNSSSKINQTANGVIQASYDPKNDQTRNVQVAATADVPNVVPANSNEMSASRIPVAGLDFYQAGMKALAEQDEAAAAAYFQKAWENREALDGATRQSIKDQLERLMPSNADTILKATLASQESDINIESIKTDQRSTFSKLQSEVFKERAAAERLLETKPREALERMSMVRGRIGQSNLDSDSQRPLLAMIDRDINEMQKYIEQNLPDIINDENNSANKDLVERRQQRRIDVEQQLQKLVEEYNSLIDEKRYAEAGVVVRQASDLAPEDTVVQMLREKHRIQSNVERGEAIQTMKEQRFVDSLAASEAAGISWDHNNLLEFPADLETYERNARKRLAKMNVNQYKSEAERNIWNALKNEQVQGEYRGTLAEAIQQLSQQAGVNIIFDEMALTAEGIKKDRLVDVPIQSPISLQSALEVVLSQAGLVFIVESEVIKVTSKESRNSNLVTKTYYIGDLVMPMNQNPDPLQMNWMTPNAPSAMGGGSMNALGANSLQNGNNSQIAMAQQMAGGGGNMGGNPFNSMGGYGGGNGPQTGTPAFATVGNQHFGGVSERDFQPLIELIQNTIHNDSWLETGQGLGTIQAFVPNLSLIVSQTQEIQDEIQDLLKKLRELNDVQIVIEVRFITLSDQFFERVGVDFDFAINDNNNAAFDPNSDSRSQSAVVGRGPTDPFTATDDLDLQFLQSSFNVATPSFGGFSPATAASFGFAILSDIEVFFLIQASKGDTRTNIMQAPTVTMFNGQSASVSDGANRPFVTSVIPVVGDFAVAHQPVITILPDGTNLNVQAVVSDDRRFVRLNLVPFFSQVTDVQTFMFDGSTRTERTTGSVLDDLLDAVDGRADASDEELVTTTQGITVQLPVLSFTTVNTVVSVPDGGTVLMGGIKRMNEERKESGIPFLSNVPYVNRLFKNVSIGHQTSNLMMMVTPRIIIQKEIEEDQVGSFTN